MTVMATNMLPLIGVCRQTHRCTHAQRVHWCITHAHSTAAFGAFNVQTMRNEQGYNKTLGSKCVRRNRNLRL